MTVHPNQNRQLRASVTLVSFAKWTKEYCCTEPQANQVIHFGLQRPTNWTSKQVRCHSNNSDHEGLSSILSYVDAYSSQFCRVCLYEWYYPQTDHTCLLLYPYLPITQNRNHSHHFFSSDDLSTVQNWVANTPALHVSRIQPEDEQSWISVFIIYFNISRQTRGQYLKLDYECAQTHPFQDNIHIPSHRLTDWMLSNEPWTKITCVHISSYTFKWNASVVQATFTAKM